MTIYERLDDETRRKLNAKEPVVHRHQKKSKEELSRRSYVNKKLQMGLNLK